MNFLYVAFNNNWGDAAAIYRMNTTLDVKMLLKKKKEKRKKNFKVLPSNFRAFAYSNESFELIVTLKSTTVM